MCPDITHVVHSIDKHYIATHHTDLTFRVLNYIGTQRISIQTHCYSVEPN